MSSKSKKISCIANIGVAIELVYSSLDLLTRFNKRYDSKNHET